MVIFNLKGLLVGIVVIVVFLFFAIMDRVGLGFSLAGLIGFLVSSLITDKSNWYKSSPTVFFIPTHFYSIVIFLFGVIAFSRQDTIQNVEKREKDKQEIEEMVKHIPNLNDDKYLLLSNKYNKEILICKKIDSFLLMSLDTNYYPEEFSFLVSKRKNKLLILVDTEPTPLIDDNYKVGIYQKIEELFKLDTLFQNKTKYMGMYENGIFHEAVKVDASGKSTSIYSIDRLSKYYKD